VPVGDALEAHGFRPTAARLAPLATLRMDLARSSDELLRAMRPSTRSKIRQAERRGVVVRPGDEEDLPLLFRALDSTALKHEFHPYPPRYYEALWRGFRPGEHSQLFIAEHEGEPLSVVFLVRYGQSVAYQIGGWWTLPPGIRPNEYLHWRAMLWCQERGHRWYDFEGIDQRAANDLLAGRKTPVDARSGVTHFKLGFGGDVVLFPGAYEYTFRPKRAAAFHRLAPTVDQWRASMQHGVTTARSSMSRALAGSRVRARAGRADR
jgi:lipid II:glycine glycyltransferase (peptidoglycan interpeptide bridge formation enzyme)